MPNDGIDQRALTSLIEEADDVQSDAMRSTRQSLEEMTESGHERRARGGEQLEETQAFETTRNSLLQNAAFSKGALATLGFGTALVALSQTPAWADKSSDVQTLQTAAAIENLAVATYATALTLPFIGGGQANPVVKTFATKTRAQHQDHAQAFNAAITQLGGAPQNKPDPALLAVVNKAKPTLTDPGKVVALALQLEDGAAQTYVANTAALGDANARKVTASVMGVEAQHVAVLRAVQALLNAGAAGLIALPPAAAKLPAAAGSVGFPDAFYPTDKARPAQEGAVK